VGGKLSTLLDRDACSLNCSAIGRRPVSSMGIAALYHPLSIVVHFKRFDYFSSEFIELDNKLISHLLIVRVNNLSFAFC